MDVMPRFIFPWALLLLALLPWTLWVGARMRSMSRSRKWVALVMRCLILAALIGALAGAELLIYPTAIGWESSDSAPEKARQRDAWITVQRAHAIANGLPVVSVNRTGFEPDPSGVTGGIQFWGSSFVAGPQGEMLLEAPTDKEAALVVVGTLIGFVAIWIALVFFYAEIYWNQRRTQVAATS